MADDFGYDDDLTRCSFCGRTRMEVPGLIQGGYGAGAYICDECVARCAQMIAPEAEKAAQKAAPVRAVEPRRTPADTPVYLVPPSQIRAYLDRYVVGQDAAKRTLSVAVYNHYKRINIEVNQRLRAGRSKDGDPRDGSAFDSWKDAAVPPEQIDDSPVGDLGGLRRYRADPSSLGNVTVAKSNVLLLGPTGTGKTYLAQTLARIMNVPFVIIDATTLTEAGYVGDDVETVLQRLIEAADGDVTRAERGIVYIDEIDKIARKSGENTSLTRDVSGEGVQQALLKIIEGARVNVPRQGTRKHREQDMIAVNTRDILFICGGAFVGLEDIIRNRMGRRMAGFSTGSAEQDIPSDEIMFNVTADDLEEYGLLPEFIGRLPVVAALHGLDSVDLSHILTDPDNSLVRQYQKLFAAESVRLSFTTEAVDTIAQTALSRGVGARGLRSIMEHVLEDTMYELPDRDDVGEVIVTKAAVEGEESPRMILRDQMPV